MGTTCKIGHQNQSIWVNNIQYIQNHWRKYLFSISTFWVICYILSPIYKLHNSAFTSHNDCLQDKQHNYYHQNMGNSQDNTSISFQSNYKSDVGDNSSILFSLDQNILDDNTRCIAARSKIYFQDINILAFVC